MTAARQFSPAEDKPGPIRAARGLTPAPARAPRFDDEARPDPPTGAGRRDRALPFHDPAHRTRPLTVVPPLLTGASGFYERGDLPDPVRFGRGFVQAVLEVLSGHRTAAQIAPFASAGVHAALARDHAGANRLGGRGRTAVLHSLRVMEPARGVAEVCAVVQAGPRYRAIAGRLEAVDGRWRCVRLQIG